MKLDRDLLRLQALALAIASLSLAERRATKERLEHYKGAVLDLCQELLPLLDWNQHLEQGLSQLGHWESQGIEVTTWFDPTYPSQLRLIEDPPFVLFSKGASPALFDFCQCVAIVGSRRADKAGLELAEYFAKTLGAKGLTIISGLALGIDGAAHSGALAGQGQLPTVAVLGGGVDLIYPPSNRELAENMLQQGGSLISQFEPGSAPYPSNFLNRNRIISGLSKVVVVIQATLRSGSLVTARYALEQGKEVLVVPGDIDNPRFEGSNRLIQQGATLITGVQDIFEIIGYEPSIVEVSGQQPTKPAFSNLGSKIERQIIEALQDRQQVRVDELVRSLGHVNFEKELLMLELNGVIQRLPGNVLRIRKQ